MKKPRYLTRLSQIPELGDERSRLEPIADQGDIYVIENHH